MLRPEVELRGGRLERVEHEVPDPGGQAFLDLAQHLGRASREVDALEVLERTPGSHDPRERLALLGKGLLRVVGRDEMQEVLVRERERGGVAPCRFEGGDDLGTVLHDLGGEARRPRDPSVGVDDAAKDRRREGRRLRRGRVRELPASGDPHLEPSAHRRADLHLIELVEATVEAHRSPGEQPPDDLERLVGARAAFGLPLADRFELPLVPAGAGAEDEPLAGERLQGRELLRQDDRVAGGHDEDRGPEADPAGRRRRVRQRDDRVEPRHVVEAVPVQEMVGRPERIEPELLGAPRERGDLLAAAPVRADEGRKEDPDPKAGRGGRHQRRPATFSARSTRSCSAASSGRSGGRTCASSITPRRTSVCFTRAR